MYPIWLDYWKTVWGGSPALDRSSDDHHTVDGFAEPHDSSAIDIQAWPFETALCVLNEELEISRHSPNFCAVMGLRQRETASGEFCSLLDADAAKQFYYGLQQVLLSNKDLMVPVMRCRVRQVPVHWVQVSGMCCEEGIMLCVRDISREMQQERELMRARINAELAQRSRSEFLGRMSHELRTPLNAVIGFAQMIEQQMSGPLNHPVYEEYLHSIKESGEHLLDKINNLLAISEAELGEVELQEENVSLAAILRNASEHHQHYAFSKDVQLTLSLNDQESPIMRLDPALMVKALSNLIENAISFTEPGGKVAIDIEVTSDNEVLIHIRDTGIGMGEHLVRCMQEFFHGNYAACNHYEQIPLGTGLMLTREYVQLHQAVLTVRSEKGNGAVFTVCLPASRLVAPLTVPERMPQAMMQEAIAV